jgi:hypothetical protein
MDYKNFWMDKPCPECCRDACAKDPKCKAFTYVKPMGSKKAHCWLKQSIPPAKKNTWCISGVRQGLPSASTSNEFFSEKCECTIRLGEAGQTFTYGRSLKERESFYLEAVHESSFIRSTTGPCLFTVYNGRNFSGRYVTIGTNLSERGKVTMDGISRDARIRAGMDGVKNKDKGGGETWRVRSVHIERVPTICKITLGGNNVSLDYYGMKGDKIRIIPMMTFIRETKGDCIYTVYNSQGLRNRPKQYQFVTKRTRVGYGVRSLEFK